MEYIPLAHAHVTQHTSGNKRTEWSVQENETDKVLGELPERLTELEIFSILNFARKYELEAFNKGIEFGKEVYKQTFNSEISQLRENLRLARHENERLAEAIEILTNNI